MRWVEVVEMVEVAEVVAGEAVVAGRAVWGVQRLPGRTAIASAPPVDSGRHTWSVSLVIRGNAPSAAQRWRASSGCGGMRL